MDDNRTQCKEEKILRLIGKLDEELGDSYSISTTIQVALKYILKALNRTEGGLVLAEHQQGGEHNQVWINPLPGWVDAKQSISHDLLVMMEKVIQTNSSVSMENAIIFPVSTGELVNAVLVLENKSLSSEEISILKFLTLLTARKIDFLESHAVSINRAQFLSLIKMISAGHESHEEIDAIELNFARGLSDIFNAEMVSFILPLESESSQAERKIYIHNTGWNKTDRVSLEKGVVGQCFFKKKLLQWEDVQKSEYFSAEVDTLPEIVVRKMICIPLLVEENCLGVLSIANSPKVPLSYPDRNLVTTLASAIASIIKNRMRVNTLAIENRELSETANEVINSRNTLRILFDNISASMYIIDQQYRILAINKVRAERAGSTPTNLVGQICYQALYNSQEPCKNCLVAATLKEGENTLRTERFWDKNDRVTDWEINTYAIFDDHGQPIQAILNEQDITEKRRLEAELIQSEKLAAVGQLAAGVAHEINNPLAAVIANAQILKLDIPPENEDMMESVKLIELAGLRASHVVKNLLGMARKDQYEFKPVDLNESIQDALSLLSHEFVARPISIRFERSKGMPLITASREHLESVWINLIMNAIEAIGEAKGEININTFYDGGFFYVLVKDTGGGIPPEQLGRIFEPFFTTKGHGRGTGLGLFLVQQIIKAHSGQIQVESEIGAGTTFTVILPDKNLPVKSSN